MTQGIMSREKGVKEQHLHLHMVFHISFSDKKAHIDKLKRFLMDFLLGIPTINKKSPVPKHITSYFSYYSKEDMKKITPGHRIKLDIILINQQSYFHYKLAIC